MSRILVRKSDILKIDDEEGMRNFTSSEKEDANKPKAGDDFSAYKDYYGNYPDAKAAFDTDLFSAQRNPKSTNIPAPEPEPEKLTPEELIEEAKQQERQEMLDAMTGEERMKFLGEELADANEEFFTPSSPPTEAQPSAPMQPDAESVAIPPGFKHGLGARARKVLTEDGRLKRIIVENEEGGVQDAGLSHNMLVQDPSGTSPYFRSRKGPRDQIPMSKFLRRFMSKEPQRAAQLFGYPHMADRKTTTQDDRDERMQMQIGMALHAMREDPNVLANLVNAQGLAVTDKSVPTTPEEALAQVKRNFPQVTVPSQQEQLAVEMMREHFPDAIPEGNPTLAAAFGEIDRMSDDDDMVQQDLGPRIRQLQEGIEAEKERTAELGRQGAENPVQQRMEQQLRELMQQASNPNLGISAEDLQELTVGQGEKVDVQGVVQRKPDSETQSSRLDQRILNTFGADKAQANPKEFERFRNFALNRLDAIDLADDRARREFAESEEKRFEEQGGYEAGAERPLMTQDKADEMFGTPATQFGFGTERTDDPIEDALQSAMMIHQRAEAERPDDLTGIVQSDYDKTVGEAMQARAGLEGGANIDDTRDMLHHLNNEIETQQELLAEQGEATAKLRQRGRKNAVAVNIQNHINQLIMLRNNARLTLQALIEGRGGARRAAGTPAPTPELARTGRALAQGGDDMTPNPNRGMNIPAVTEEQSAEARAFDSTLDRVGAVQPDAKIQRLNERGQRRDKKYEANTPAIDFTQGQNAPPPPEPETDEERIARLINEAMNPDNVETGFPMSLGTQLLKGIQHDLYYKGV